MDSSISELGAEANEKRREINKMRNDMRMYVKQEMKEVDSIIAEYKKSHIMKEEPIICNIIEKLSSNLAYKQDENPNENIRKNLEDAIYNIDQIGDEYIRQYIDQEVKKGKQRMNLDRALYDLPESTNDMNIYFSAYSKVHDLNAKYNNISLMKDAIESETNRSKSRNQECMEALNSLIDHKKKQGETLITFQKYLYQIQSKAPKRENDPADYAKIAKLELRNINADNADPFYSCVESILDEIIKDEPDIQNIDSKLQDIESLVAPKLEVVPEKSQNDYKKLLDEYSEKFKRLRKE